MKFSQWKENILRSEKDRVGNELPDNKVVAGGDLNVGPKQFVDQLDGFKSKIANSKDKAEGLGDKGMESVSNSTFSKSTNTAGKTPTISNGIPVDGPKGQFESFCLMKELATIPDPAETDAVADPSVATAVDPPQEDNVRANEENPYGLPPMLLTYLDKAFEVASRMGPQKYRGFAMHVQQQLQRGISDSRLSDGAGRQVAIQQSLDWRRGLN